jgi:alpha-ribazole phosphatase
MRVYFMRHGQTDFNRKGLCNDDPQRPVSLNQAGLRQAQRAAERLRAAPLQRIYVSPLPRTAQTAEIVNRYHRAPIDVQPAINDIRSGHDGRPVGEYQRAIAHDPLHARPAGGESLLEHKHRVLGFVDWLRRQPYDTVLVVAHEETLRVFYAHVHGLEDARLPELSFDNCEIFTADLS